MKTDSRLHRNTLARALAFVLFAPSAVLAQNTATEPAEPSAQAQPATDAGAKQLDKVTVTGSRIKRAEVEGPAPVTIVTAEQIKKEGFTTVYDALSTFTEAMGTVESDIQWGQHTVNASPLNLRNMGPGRSLLLINGRRVADYPLPYSGKSNFANMNNIPTGAVERIEVMASGASAIYGSDAVAGVINVILKTDYSGDELKVRVGTSTRGGRDMNDVSWAGGKTGQNWSVTYALQHYFREPLSAGQRPFMDSEFDAPFPSLSPEDRAIGAVSRPSVGVRLLDVGTGLRVTPPAGACDRYGDYFFLHDRQSLVGNTPGVPGTGTLTSTGMQCAQTATFRDWTLRNGSEDNSGYLYGTWDFDSGVQAWTTLGVWSSEGTSMTFLPGWSADWTDAATGNAYNGAKAFTPNEIGGLQAGGHTHSDELAWDVAFGLRGTVFNDRFDWDFSIGRAEYRVDEKFPTIVTAAADEFFLGQNRDTLNQDRFWNPITPEEYRSISTIGRNHAESWVDQASFSLTGDLFEGWAGPIGFAAVLEAAKQGYELAPDPNTLGDNPAYQQTANIDLGGGERKRYAAGVEFKVPLLDTLTASLAGRYDRYDQVADDAATTWNAGLEWRPWDNLLLRGSYATSFRAPDMHFVYAQSSSFLRDLTDVYACVTTGATDANGNVNPACEQLPAEDAQDVSVQRAGTPDLKYETGRSWTYGLVWDITENLSISADYWNIELDDEIDDINESTVLEDEAWCRTGKTTSGIPKGNLPIGGELCQLQISRVTRDAAGQIVGVETGPINRAQRYVSGIDATLDYLLPTASWGDFNFALNYTNLQSLETRQFVTDPLYNTRDREPRSKMRGSVNWQREKWSATLYADRIGSVPGVRNGDNGNGVYGGCYPLADGTVPNFGTAECVGYFGRIGPAVTWSTSVGYQFSPKAKVTLFVSNILDEVNEEKDPFKKDFAFIQDRIFSPVGREFSVEFAYKFN